MTGTLLEIFMREAIRLSAEGAQSGKGGPFGAVIVRDGQIIGKGCNQVTSTNDPTAHAEVVAIRAACQLLQTFHLKGCVMFTSCEPCPMCLSAIYWAQIDQVYYANTHQDAAHIGFSDAFLYEEISKPIEQRAIPMVQLLRTEAQPVFRQWQDKNDKIQY